MSPTATTQIPTNLPPPKPNHSFTRRPSSRIGIFLWKQRMWFESTFVFSMLEPWEKIMLLGISILLFTLLVTGILKYFPHHLLFLRGRAIYYLWGKEGDERALWQWLGLVGHNGVITTHKEL